MTPETIEFGSGLLTVSRFDGETRVQSFLQVNKVVAISRLFVMGLPSFVVEWPLRA